MTDTVDTAAPDTADTGSYDYDKLYIGGRWEAPHSTDVLEVHSPATGMRVGSAPHGDATDVDTAVAAASRRQKIRVE